MINRCGYITFCDENTNILNIATVVAYNCSNITDADESNKSIYKYNFVTGKMVNCIENENSKLSYLNLLDIINKGLTIDKLNNHITKYIFSFDLNEKVHIYSNSILKSCFPLPNKNFVYAKEQYYYNFTNIILGCDITSNLHASVVCDHLNNIAVINGYRSNRMFEHSCGRVLLNISMFLNSIEGRKILKQIICDYNKVSDTAKVRLNRLTVKKYKVAYQSVYTSSDCINFALKHHVKTALQLKNINLTDALKDIAHIKQVVECEVEYLVKDFEQLYLKLYTGLKPGDVCYLTFDELLKMLTDSEFSYNINSHIANVRKIYNANKNRKFDCIKSDGSIYCIQ